MLLLTTWVCYWIMDAPWKVSLTRLNTSYLPVPPMFALARLNNGVPVFIDRLVSRLENDTIVTDKRCGALLSELNNETNIEENIRELHERCNENADYHACLIVGRIWEFGAYNRTANQTTAMHYFRAAGKLGNSVAQLPMLSFFHRHNTQNVEMSLVEQDLSMVMLESSLAAANQYLKGILRPRSCPRAVKILVKVAEAVQHMKLIETDVIPEQLKQESSDLESPQYWYARALKQMSVPYPSLEELQVAEVMLKHAVNASYPPSYGAMSIVMRAMNKSSLKAQQEMMRLLHMGHKVEDTGSSVEYAKLLIQKNIPAIATNGAHILSKLADLGVPQAMTEFAILKYYGLLGVGRSNKIAFTLFERASAAGCQKATIHAAEQLISGDGAPADCERAASMLLRIIETGPWSQFFNAYVDKESPHAFLKMIDLGLTPSIAVSVPAKKAFTKELLENTRVMNQSGAMRRIRAAQRGDWQSVIWLALTAGLEDAKMWIDRLAIMPSFASVFAGPIRNIVIAKNLVNWARGLLSDADIALLKSMIKPDPKTLRIAWVTIALWLLVIARIRATFP